MDKPKYPDVKVKLTGRDGNVFSIIGSTAAMLRRTHGNAAAEAYRREAMDQTSYDAVLRLTIQTVEVE